MLLLICLPFADEEAIDSMPTEDSEVTMELPNMILMIRWKKFRGMMVSSFWLSFFISLSFFSFSPDSKVFVVLNC